MYISPNDLIRFAKRNREIYEKYKTGDFSSSILAKEYGITRQRILKIVQRQKHLLTNVVK